MTALDLLPVDPVAADGRCAVPEGTIRYVRPEECRAIAAVMRSYLAAAFDGPEILRVLVWERAHQGLGGFLAFSTRTVGSLSADCPLLCIHALWVASYLPRADIERCLVEAARVCGTHRKPPNVRSAERYVACCADDQEPVPLARLAVIARDHLQCLGV